ncbi:general substrate transporter [Coniophora puteana RWD-64-598 SS2]|uniref:General substrate transporter n=1 Tax=Coniophora puteana (strain RWD-64-598) TaxID=741705 RepID=A0A5M3MDQ6_CONPW|nr:general substrate transporter [Coniophora puteana RWD-64-598 SS2]EIW77177.1 general substrate transporter [Coniophora puteana RWD-64-598 SS2]
MAADERKKRRETSMSDVKEAVENIEEIGRGTSSPAVPALGALAKAAATDRALSPLQAIRLYWRAFFWCLFMCIGALLAGYDVQITGGLLSVPSFRRDFGFESGGQYILAASWQSAFNSASSVGCMLGGLSVGIISDKLGRRGTVGICGIISLVGIFIQFFTPAHNNGMLVAGKFINGISLGIYVATSSSYCVELSPTALRGITTAAVNLWVAFGQLLSNAAIRGAGARTDAYAYRIPFATQFIFPVILLLGLPFAPESPWWLVRKHRMEDAHRVIAWVGGANAQAVADTDTDVDLQLRQIRETIELEDYYARTSRLWDLFRGANRRRTAISCMVFVVQQSSGVTFVIGFSSYFFELAGFSDNASFDLGLVVTAVGVAGNLLVLYTLNRFGRRTIWNASLYGCAFVNLLIGFLSIRTTEGTRLGVVAFVIIYLFIYQAGLGPLGYTIYAEVPSSKLRSKAVGMGILTNQCCTMIVNIVVPYLVNPDEANLNGYVGFIFGGFAVLGSIWSWFYIPETKDRTIDELDVMFEERVPARKFASYTFKKADL